MRWRAGDVKNSTRISDLGRRFAQIGPEVGKSVTPRSVMESRSQITELRAQRSDHRAHISEPLLAHGAVGGAMTSELRPAL